MPPNDKSIEISNLKESLKDENVILKREREFPWKIFISRERM